MPNLAAISSTANTARPVRDTRRDEEGKRTQAFIHAAQPTRIDLAKVDRAGLHQLLEHHAVLAVLARRDTNTERLQRTTNGRMAKHIIGRGRFLDPPWLELGERAHPVDRLRYRR
jgi:hypothetical protein